MAKLSRLAERMHVHEGTLAVYIVAVAPSRRRDVVTQPVVVRTV